MSQLLCRIAKLISPSSFVKTKNHGLCFSKFRSLSTAATPYLLFNPTDKYEMTLSGEPLVDLNLYDPRKDETVKIPDQTLTEELLSSTIAGSSRGWVVAKNIYDSTLRLTNMFNTCASASSRKIISLPPTSDRICRISLSASPEQEDCVVAAMSTGSSVSMCRPGDSEWTRIKKPFYAWEMMYSMRDGKFYLKKMGQRDYNGPVDLLDTSSSGFPQLSMYPEEFPLSDIPKSRLEQLSSTKKSEHIVESPSGESFIVYWYEEYLHLYKEEYDAALAEEPPYQSSIRIKPRGFVVFRQDHDHNISCYTEDIGDLCIFLGSNEAFCVSATEYPGLKPNSIYFASTFTGFGFYDLSSNTVHDVINPPPFFCNNKWLPALQ